MAKPIDADAEFRKPKAKNPEIERQAQEAAEMIATVLGKGGAA